MLQKPINSGLLFRMGTNLPIPAEAYKDLDFDMFPYILTGYFWLNSTFTDSYRFMPAYEDTVTLKKGKLMHSSAADPKAVSFNNDYSMEYHFDNKQLYMSFLGNRFLVNAIKVHYGEITSMILEATAPDGTVQRFYSARTQPFNGMHRDIYGV